MWKVGRTLLLAFTAAVLVAGSIFTVLVVLLDFRALDTGTKLDAKTLFDLVKLSFGVVAGAGALVALVVAYRRQRVDEAGAHRESTRLHTERFSAAVDKLGSDSPAVRLGGIHALSGLADDAPAPNCARPVLTSCAPTSAFPTHPTPATCPTSSPTTPRPPRNSAKHTRPSRTGSANCAKYGTRSCASSGTTTASPPRTIAAPGRATISISPASPSTAPWISPVHSSPAAP
ncbi:hypothetical protein [Streptomyces cremeus]|uniref:Uncharacterized protein n=1 Tax=Streptomyces cremeus TaxID=66881 RepID=A0ABV5PIV9_STRCM